MEFEAIRKRQNALLCDKKQRLERYLSVLKLQYAAILSEDTRSVETYGDIASFCLHGVFAVEKSLMSFSAEFGKSLFDANLANSVRDLEEKIFEQTEININLAKNLTESLFRQIEMQKRFFSVDFFNKNGQILKLQA